MPASGHGSDDLVGASSPARSRILIALSAATASACLARDLLAVGNSSARGFWSVDAESPVGCGRRGSPRRKRMPRASFQGRCSMLEQGWLNRCRANPRGGLSSAARGAMDAPVRSRPAQTGGVMRTNGSSRCCALRRLACERRRPSHCVARRTLVAHRTAAVHARLSAWMPGEPAPPGALQRTPRAAAVAADGKAGGRMSPVDTPLIGCASRAGSDMEVTPTAARKLSTIDGWWRRLVHGTRRLFARADWHEYVGRGIGRNTSCRPRRHRRFLHEKQGRNTGLALVLHANGANSSLFI